MRKKRIRIVIIEILFVIRMISDNINEYLNLNNDWEKLIFTSRSVLSMSNLTSFIKNLECKSFLIF